MNITVEIKSPELAAAINALAAAIAGREGPFALATPAEAAADPEKPKTRARSAKAETTTQNTADPKVEDGQGPGETAQDQANEESASDGQTDVPDYSLVKKAVLELTLATDRATTVGLLTKFGVPEGGKADQIDKSRWQAFIDAAAELAAS